MLADITPVILTCNEAANIGRSLERLTWATRIVVVDSGSTDGTLDIVTRFPNVRAVHRPFVTWAADPRYARLMEAFRDITGVPVVLNASFNGNEPVVCRPDEAMDCFLRTRMDVLVLDDTLIKR